MTPDQLRWASWIFYLASAFFLVVGEVVSRVAERRIRRHHNDGGLSDMTRWLFLLAMVYVVIGSVTGIFAAAALMGGSS